MDMKTKLKNAAWVWFVAVFLSMATEAQAQTVTVTGRVTSVNGESLPGVNILVIEQETGTITNIEGEYEVSAPSNATLRFSYIGYETQNIPVEGRTTIDVQLTESTAALDEVIVMGYTTDSKRQVSSSIAPVSGEKLVQVLTHDPTATLAGQVAVAIIEHECGRPDHNADLIIRGSGSISASTSPLNVMGDIIAGAVARDAVCPS